MSNILRVSYQAYNSRTRQYAHCFTFIQELLFSISNVYKLTISNHYSICSEIKIDRLIEERCKNEGGDFWKQYLIAQNKGHSFTDFPDKGHLDIGFRVPRIGEKDFEKVITDLGGIKIPETQYKTPDFVLQNIVLELKDLQEDGLNNKERQNNIAKLFENYSNYSIDINPTLDYGAITTQYHKMIKNTIRNNFKKASKQIKSYMIDNKVASAGLIILNSGLFSLPHELFKSMVEDILENESTTIKFAFVFSEKMQTNGWDIYTIFFSDLVGIVPDEVTKIKQGISDHVNQKMTDMIKKNESEQAIKSQHPISFEINNKVFYWNPVQLKFPWEK